MPRIFDNIDLFFSASLTDMIKVVYKAVFIINYDIKYRMGKDWIKQ